MVLMIINRQSTLSDKITETSIVSLVMFGVDDICGTCIDFIATVGPYTGMSFGPFLLHNAQVFGCKAVQRLSNGNIHNNNTTVLMCKKSLSFYYQRLGFATCNNEDFLANGNFSGAGTRFEIDKWHQTNPNNMVIMKTNTKCPRAVNHLSYFRSDIESIVFNDESSDDWKHLLQYEKIRKHFDDGFVQLIKDRKYMKQNIYLQDMYLQSPSKFFENLYNSAFVIPVGDLYRSCLSVYKITDLPSNSEDGHFSSLFEVAIDPLQLFLYPEDISNNNFNDQECWAKVKCGHCNKHAFVKKERDDNFSLYLTKAVTSVWFIHVFNLAPIENNAWYEYNKSWNMCASRKGVIYDKIKAAFHKDSHLFNDIFPDVYKKCLLILDFFVGIITVQFGKLF